jgi:hypothetical protein
VQGKGTRYRLSIRRILTVLDEAGEDGLERLGEVVGVPDREAHGRVDEENVVVALADVDTIVLEQPEENG